MNIEIKFVFDEDQTFYVYGHRTNYQGFANLIGNCLKIPKDGSIDILLAIYSNNMSDKKSYATLFKLGLPDLKSYISPPLLTTMCFFRGMPIETDVLNSKRS